MSEHTNSTGTVLISRDFDYSNPARPVLDTVRGGMRERLVFNSLRDALAAHEYLRANGAQYIDAHEDGQHWRWAAAPRRIEATQ